MTKLPRDLSGKRVIKAMERIGFRVCRQKGSHVVLKRVQPQARVVIPDHHALDTGTLDVILDGAGLTVDEFIALL